MAKTSTISIDDHAEWARRDRAAMDALAAPIPADRIRERQGSNGQMFKYIKDATVRERLDAVLGPQNWSMGVQMHPDCSVCALTITLPSGLVVSRTGVGGWPDPEQTRLGREDWPKSAATDAFKRAGVQFGIGEELYDDAPHGGGQRAPQGQGGGQAQRTGWGGKPLPERPQRGQGQGGGQGQQYSGPPKSGKALFAWTKDQEQRHEVGLLKYLNNWAKLQDWPGRMVDWDADMVAKAYAEAQRKIEAIAPAAGAGYREPGDDDGDDEVPY